jgi:hypothetical protein
MEATSWVLRLHDVRLLRKFVAGAKSKHPTIYPTGSVQLVWQDRFGRLWLRGKETGWEFSTTSKPGVDFEWIGGDPRSPEEIAAARPFPAAIGKGEDGYNDRDDPV